MPPIFRLRAAIATLVSIAVGFGVAIAQEQTTPGAMDPGAGGREMMERQMMCRADQHIDGQLANLKT